MVDAYGKSALISRRKVIKSLAVSGSAVSAAKLIPDEWARPLVESAMLPAHAQATYTITCEGDPPAGTSYPINEPISVLVTVTPNPGAGQIIQVQGFCNGQDDFIDTLVTDGNGQANSSGDLSFCAVGDEACVRFTFGGASTECCWTATRSVVCLAHGTRVVKSTHSHVSIESLRVGDLIMGLSDQRNKLDYTVVTKVITDHIREACYCINGELFITNDHPVLVLRDDSLHWCPVEKLVLGDQLRTSNGFIKVNQLEFVPGTLKTVYVETSCGNFIASGADNAYVVKSDYAAHGIMRPIRAEEFDWIEV